MRVQKTSFLKYVSREQRTRLLRLLLILVFRSFFKSLPLCSIVPDGCTGDDIKIAWGYKKNKVRPRNKVDTGDNVMDGISTYIKNRVPRFWHWYFRKNASLENMATTAFSLKKANTYYIYRICSIDVYKVYSCTCHWQFITSCEPKFFIVSRFF